MRLLPLAAALLLAVPAAAGDPRLEELEQKIVQERDPVESRMFLTASDHEALRAADPAVFDRVYQAASENADLHQVLLDHFHPGPLREALSSRERYRLLQRPADLLAWRRRKLDFIDEKSLREALLEWDTLSREVRGELTKGGHGSRAWGGLSLGLRVEALGAALAPALERLMASVARTPAEAKALRDQAGRLWPYLEKDDRDALYQHMEKVEAGAAGLEQARALLGRKPDPALAAKLAEARAAGNVDDLLGKLGSLFDGLGERSAAVERAGPGRADQRLDDAGRATLAEMLKAGALREMRGTAVGDRLAKFYEKEPLNLVVKSLPPGIMGWHQHKDDEIAVNEDLILRMAREEGKTAQDLITDPALFDRVLKSALSTIVHECVHQEQAAWRRDGKLPHWHVCEHEVEAKSLEAAFILEKSAKDKGYAKFLAENQERSTFVRESVLLSNDLRRNPRSFAARIRADYYPNRVSIEGFAAFAYDDSFIQGTRADIEAELARRAAMDPARRKVAEAVGKDHIEGHVRSREAWRTALQGVTSQALEEWRKRADDALARRQEQRPEVPRHHAAYRRRDAETQALTASVLASLGAPAGAAPRSAVPPPSVTPDREAAR